MTEFAPKTQERAEVCPASRIRLRDAVPDFGKGLFWRLHAAHNVTAIDCNIPFPWDRRSWVSRIEERRADFPKDQTLAGIIWSDKHRYCAG
jgi:hypothetical protein